MISKLIEENRKEDGMVANEEMFRNVAGVMYAAGAGLVRPQIIYHFRVYLMIYIPDTDSFIYRNIFLGYGFVP